MTGQRSAKNFTVEEKHLFDANPKVVEFVARRAAIKKHENRELYVYLRPRKSDYENHWELITLARYRYEDATFGNSFPRDVYKSDLKYLRSKKLAKALEAISKLNSERSWGYDDNCSKLILKGFDEDQILNLLSLSDSLWVKDELDGLKSVKYVEASTDAPLNLAIEILKASYGFSATAYIASSSKKFSIDANIRTHGRYTLAGGKLFLSQLQDHEENLNLFRSNRKLEMKSSEITEFLDGIFHKELIPKVILPGELSYKKIKLDPKVRIVIDRVDGPHLRVDIEFRYGDFYIEYKEPRYRLLDHDLKIIHERSLSTEKNNRTELYSFIGRVRPNSAGVMVFRENQVQELINKAFDKGWEVVAFKKKVSRISEYKLKTSSGIDWFDLSMDMRFFNGQKLALPDLLRGLHSGKKMITLADGSVGVLSDEVIRNFSHLGMGAKVVGNKIRLSKAQALFFSSSLKENKNFSGDKKFKELEKIARQSLKPLPSKSDPKFKGSLRTYQKRGLGWLESMCENRIGCLLADDMGLGKTVSILSLLSKRLKNKAIIVVPKSLVFNWQSEAEKFTPHLPVCIYYGSGRSIKSKEFKDSKIVITTYHTLRSDIDKLSKIGFEFLVIDEAQNIKNPESDIHISTKLIRADQKIALTGTPIENSVGDLFSILSVISPGLISKSTFEKHAGTDDPVVLNSIYRAVSPFFLRRRKEDVLKELPKKTEKTILCELLPGERRDYEQLRKFHWATLKDQIAKKGIGGSSIQILQALLQLRQAACHQGILQARHKKRPSAKFEALLEHLETIVEEGHKVLVFSNFLVAIDILKTELRKRKIEFETIDGSTSGRQSIVNRFQNTDETKVLLMTLKTGGVGLNLTAANYVFILDPWWNPAAESQGIDRTHRIGQKKKVMAYKLIAKGTVEEKVLALQKKKRAIANAIMEGSGKVSKLTKEDLELLFG